MTRALVLLLLVAGCSGGHPPAAPELPAVKVKLVPGEELGERTWVPVTVTAVDHAVLATRVSARIADVSVAEGARVKRGDVLVRLSDDDVRAALKAAESQREVAEAQVKRIQALRSANAATATEVLAVDRVPDLVGLVEPAGAVVGEALVAAEWPRPHTR